MGFLRSGNGNDARASAFNRNFPSEPKYDAHGTDFRNLPEGPLRIDGRSLNLRRWAPRQRGLGTDGVVDVNGAMGLGELTLLGYVSTDPGNTGMPPVTSTKTIFTLPTSIG